MLERVNQAWQRLKKRRKVTQAQAGEELGYRGATFFNHLLSGAKPINLETAFKLSEYFKVPPLQLFPELFEPYAAAIDSLTNEYQSEQRNKDAIIETLQERLRNAGLDVSVDKATGTGPMRGYEWEILTLLRDLPEFETRIVMDELRARVQHYREKAANAEKPQQLTAADEKEGDDTTCSDPCSDK